MTKTQAVKLSECREGDIIQTQGGRFQLVERIDERGFHHMKNENGFRSFRSVFLGVCGELVRLDGSVEPYCAVPEGWRKDWTIQSNDLATWYREIA